RSLVGPTPGGRYDGRHMRRARRRPCSGEAPEEGANDDGLERDRPGRRERDRPVVDGGRDRPLLGGARRPPAPRGRHVRALPPAAVRELAMRVLFASPYGPRRLVDGRDPLDPFTGQLSPAQGPYALRMQAHYWAFYLMAENLRAETCVLEHPTLGEFEAELRKGYDWLGLQLNWNTLREAARMIERARVVAPRTRIVVGGYALPQVMDPLPADHAVAETIRAGADQLCWTEGVTYMRTLLDDGPIE